jgi:hypothetical protein
MSCLDSAKSSGTSTVNDIFDPFRLDELVRLSSCIVSLSEFSAFEISSTSSLPGESDSRGDSFISTELCPSLNLLSAISIVFDV